VHGVLKGGGLVSDRLKNWLFVMGISALCVLAGVLVMVGVMAAGEGRCT
jgi:hypothetical protein